MSNTANTVELSARGWFILNAVAIVFAVVVTLIALPRLSKPVHDKLGKVLLVAVCLIRLMAFGIVLQTIENFLSPGIARTGKFPWHFRVLNIICTAVVEEAFGKAFPDFAVKRVFSKEPESENKT